MAICSKNAFLQVSPSHLNHTIQKGFPATFCLIVAQIAPGIAVLEGFYSGRVNVNMSERGQVMPFLVANLFSE